MADTVAIKITADMADLFTKSQIATANVRALTSEFNKLAREAVSTGDANGQLAAQMQKLAPTLLDAKNKASELSGQLKSGQQTIHLSAAAFDLAREAAAAFGLALSVEKVVEFGKSAFDTAEQVYHQAEVLGLTTDAYQAFAKSAEFSGVEVETVDQALKKFNVSQGRAQTGVGDAAKAFNDLGVNAKLPAEQALPAIARALLSIQDPARRARDEVAIFGKSGEEMNPALAEWARGVAELTKELAANGHIQSEHVVKGAHEAKAAMAEAWDRADVTWGPPIVKLTNFIAGMPDALSHATDGLHAFAAAMNLAFPNTTPEPATPFVLNAPGRPTARPNPDNAPPPNWRDKADAEKAAKQAQQIADEIARAYEQGAQRHIQSEEQTNTHLLSMGQETLAQWRSQAVALEDARYQAALDGVKKREAADANDKVKLAADQAQGAQLYQEHTDRLTSIDEQYNEKKRQEQATSLQTFISEQDQELAAAVARLDREFQLQRISSQQKHDEEVALTQQVEAEELSRLNAQNIGLVEGTAAYESFKKQQSEITTKYNKQIQDADKKLADAQAQQWETANRTILQTEQEFITGFLSGRQTLGASALQGLENFLEREIAADVAYWTERELLSLEGIGKEKVTEQEGFLERLASQLFFSTESAAAATADQAAQTTAAATGSAASKAAAVLQIPAYTGIAAMEAAAAVAGIPIVGPELAAAAFASMQGLGAAALGMASLDVGTNMVPADMMAMIHAGERVIPAADNAALMAAVSGNQGGQSGGDGGPVSLSVGNITIQGVPGNNPQTARNIINAIAAEIRNGNTTLRNAVAAT